MTNVRRAAAALSVAATLAFAATAQAAPDWTPPSGLPGDWALASVGFADDGTELAAHIDLVSQSPPDTRLTVVHRSAGTDWAPELVIDDPGSEPGDVSLAVAPGGAAVMAWMETTRPDKADSPARYRAAYRSPDGSWGAPVTLADPFPARSVDATVVTAIAADGTAVAGAVVDELSGLGELQPDTNVIVAMRPAAGDWAAPERISPYNVSAAGLRLGFDDSGQLTAAWTERYTEGVSSDGSDDRWHILTRRRAASNGIWGAANDLTGQAGSVNWPELAVGRDGRAVISWQWWHLADGTLDAWASTRASGSDPWSKAKRIVSGSSSGPRAAGVGPDGSTYVLFWRHAQSAEEDGAGVVRLVSDGAWGAPKMLRSQLDCNDGLIAFVGADAVFAWAAVDGPTSNGLVQAARWKAGSAAPEAPREIEQPGNDAVGLRSLVSDRRGSIVAIWTFMPPHTAALDGGGPELTASDVPASAIAGQTFEASASFADMWSPLAGSPTWDFGDGTAPAAGGSVDHTYAQPGTYSVTVRAADALQNETAKSFTVTVGAPQAGGDGTAPAVTLAPPRCRRHESRSACKRRRHAPAAWRTVRGAVRDAAPSSGIAAVEVAVARRGGKLRYRPASVTGAKWSRRLRLLPAGRYVFSVRARDRAGNVSAAVARSVRLRLSQ